MGIKATGFNSFRLNALTIAAGTRTNQSLNAAYVHLTSGPAIALRHVAPVASSIDEVYVFLDAFTGTLGNITMQAKIYNEHASSALIPGSTLRATSTTTTMPSGATKWIKFAFGTPYTPAVGEVLWLIVYNTAAVPATDFPQILVTTTTAFGDVSATIPYTTTNGFSASGTLGLEVPFVIVQGTHVGGQPFTQRNTTYYANNTRQRGIVIQVPSTVGVDVCGFIVNGAAVGGATAFDGFKFLADATAPGGTALSSFALGTDANESRDEVIGTKLFDAAVRLSPGTNYKATFTFAANSQTPVVNQIEDYASYSSVFDALYDGFALCWSAIDDNAGGWTIDKAISPDVVLLVEAFSAPGEYVHVS